MNKIKGKEQILEEILKIGVKHKTLLALSMKTGEYSLLPEAKQFLSKAIDKAVEEERERIKSYVLENHDYGAIPETDDYANGWNESRKRSYQQVKYLLEELSQQKDENIT